MDAISTTTEEEALDLTKRVGARQGDTGDAHTLALEENARGLEEVFVVVDDQAANGHRFSVSPIPWLTHPCYPESHESS